LPAGHKPAACVSEISIVPRPAPLKAARLDELGSALQQNLPNRIGHRVWHSGQIIVLTDEHTANKHATHLAPLTG